MKFDESLLISALNKYWRPLTAKEYKREMDLIDVSNACKIASMPKGIIDEIWAKERHFGEVY